VTSTDQISKRSAYRGAALVTVVIPCYKQAHFLGEAIESVLSQSYAHFEIVVVDDGSPDDTSEVASRYPPEKVRLIRQENRGLAGARNRGLSEARGEYVVFLDADDRLLAEALEVGVRELEAHPECAFVSGHCRFIMADGDPSEESLTSKRPPRIEGDTYGVLLSREHFLIPGAVMHKRSVVETVGGFDTSLEACEDYDLYFRIAKTFPVYHHDEVVVEYRKHETQMTRDAALMLRHTVKVLRRQREHIKSSHRYRKAYNIGLTRGRYEYGIPLIKVTRVRVRTGQWGEAVAGILVLVRYGIPREFADLPSPTLVRRWLQNTFGRLRNRPPVGWVRFGSLRRTTPISREFGYDRGKPIDRYYIEKFLARHATDVRGRVLEIGDDSYTQSFGGDRVTVSDVLHVTEGNPQATIVADLTRADHIPSDSFDCAIVTQTLHLIYDARSAIQTLRRILKPGGVLLTTFPGISQIADDQWSNTWYWAFTTQSAWRLFKEFFPAEGLEIEAHGNVLAAISFLHGLSVEELHREEL
jgi:glycosyltransferase involved in cell wall biosynthesis/SAM-dependent methyltransferase